MRPIPHVLPAVISDLSRQIKVTRFEDLFDEVFEMSAVEFVLARPPFALHEHIKGEFPQTVIQCALVAYKELLFAQLGRL